MEDVISFNFPFLIPVQDRCREELEEGGGLIVIIYSLHQIKTNTIIGFSSDGN